MKPNKPVRITTLNSQINKHAPSKILVRMIFCQYEKLLDIDTHLKNIIKLGRVAIPQNAEANINPNVAIKCFKIS